MKTSHDLHLAAIPCEAKGRARRIDSGKRARQMWRQIAASTIFITAMFQAHLAAQEVETPTLDIPRPERNIVSFKVEMKLGTKVPELQIRDTESFWGEEVAGLPLDLGDSVDLVIPIGLIKEVSVSGEQHEVILADERALLGKIRGIVRDGENEFDLAGVRSMVPLDPPKAPERRIAAPTTVWEITFHKLDKRSFRVISPYFVVENRESRMVDLAHARIGPLRRWVEKPNSFLFATKQDRHNNLRVQLSHFDKLEFAGKPYYGQPDLTVTAGETITEGYLAGFPTQKGTRTAHSGRLIAETEDTQGMFLLINPGEFSATLRKLAP